METEIRSCLSRNVSALATIHLTLVL